MKEFDKVNDFLKKIKKGKSTLYRFYRKNEDLFLETKKKRNKRLIPIEHAKYFDSEILHEENKLLVQQNGCMKNLINCLVDKDSLQRRLWMMDWSFFATLAYKAERNQKSCFKMMHAVYDSLIEKYGDDTSIRLFFTTEPFANREGYHNHFVLYVENVKLREQVIEEIKKFFSYDRLDFSVYDKFKAGMFYLAKEGLVNEDWDILGNNLENENLSNETKGNDTAI